MEMCGKITDDVRNSIEHSLSNPEEALKFAKEWEEGLMTTQMRNSSACM